MNRNYSWRYRPGGSGQENHDPPSAAATTTTPSTTSATSVVASTAALPAPPETITTPSALRTIATAPFSQFSLEASSASARVTKLLSALTPSHSSASSSSSSRISTSFSSAPARSSSLLATSVDDSSSLLFKHDSTSFTSSPNTSSTSTTSPDVPVEDGRCGFVDLPEELVVNIAEYLLELDLSRLSQTCHRFARICNDSELWRHLYVDLFEYDRPLVLNDKDRKFVFKEDDCLPSNSYNVNPSNSNNNNNNGGDDDDIRSNPWRESFKTLYRGMHVRPGAKKIYADKPALLLKPTRPPAPIQSAPMPGEKRLLTEAAASGAVPKTAPLSSSSSFGGGVRTEVAPAETSTTIRRPGRRVTHFETLSSAIDSIQGTWKRYLSILSRSKGAKVPLIFVHAGKYVEDFPDIVCDLMIIGAAGSGSQDVGVVAGGVGGGGSGSGAGGGDGGVKIAEQIRDKVVLESRTQCTVRFLEKSADSYLGYMTVRFLPEEFTEPQPRHWAMLVTGDCKPLIEHCRVRSISSYGAICHVSGENADPTIRNCDFSFGKNVGLYITNKAKGIYTYNRMSNNGLGIYCKYHSDPIIRSNEVCYNKQGGVLVSDDAVGYFERNRIFDNRVTGVEIKNEGNPVFIDNEIYGAQASGVIVYRLGQGQFLRNRIHDNADVGIFVLYKGIGFFEGNEIWNNRLAGIETRTGGSPKVVKCRIHGHGYGILLQEYGGGNFFENDVYGNSKAGVFAHQGAIGYLEANRIYKNAKAGVEIKDGANPEFVNCTIYECKAAGVVIHEEGDGKFLNCEVRDNDFAGLFLFNGAKGHFEKCVVKGNKIAGVDVKSGADPTVLECDISEQEYGVVVHEEGKGSFVKNTIHDNNEAAIFTLKTSSALFRDNDSANDKQFYDLDVFM